MEAYTKIKCMVSLPLRFPTAREIGPQKNRCTQSLFSGTFCRFCLKITVFNVDFEQNAQNRRFSTFRVAMARGFTPLRAEGGKKPTTR